MEIKSFKEHNTNSEKSKLPIITEEINERIIMYIEDTFIELNCKVRNYRDSHTSKLKWRKYESNICYCCEFDVVCYERGNIGLFFDKLNKLIKRLEKLDLDIYNIHFNDTSQSNLNYMEIYIPRTIDVST